MLNINYFRNKKFINNLTANSDTKVNVAGNVKPDIKKWKRKGFYTALISRRYDRMDYVKRL